VPDGHLVVTVQGGGRVLDLRGEVCPYTFVRTKLVLEEMPSGELVRVLVDHEPATRNVPRSLRDWGQQVVSVQPFEQGAWAITVRKTAT
jgi:TusA-related sulfurtransferase